MTSCLVKTNLFNRKTNFYLTKFLKFEHIFQFVSINYLKTNIHLVTFILIDVTFLLH